MARRTLRYMALEDVRRADVNPKLHDATVTAASMDDYGLMEPLLHDGRTGKLIAGHGRIEEMERRRQAGAAPPDGVVIQKDRWLVPIVIGWRSRDDAEAHAAGVALNRTRDAGGWVERDLYGDLERLTGGQPEPLARLGFTSVDLDDLVATRTIEYGGRDREATDDTSLGEKAATYRTNGVRSFVLDYTIEDYEAMADALARLRRRRNVTTNAIVVEQLLNEATA